MAVTATLSASWTLVQSAEDAWSGAEFQKVISKVQSLTDGTTANKADLLYVGNRTVASATNDDIDLAGSLSDFFGATITFAEIVAVLVINQAADGTANTTDLTIGNVTNGFEGFLSSSGTVGPIGPGGVFFISTPDAGGLGTVTASTADLLRVANSSGASATYQICVLGRSA